MLTILSQLMLAYLVGAYVAVVMLCLGALLLGLSSEEWWKLVRMALRLWFTPWRGAQWPARAVPMEPRPADARG